VLPEPLTPAAPRLAFITGSLGLGGSTTFLLNLGGELGRRGIPVEVSNFEKENPLASDFSRLNVPVLTQDQRQLIFEDRLLAILRSLAQFKPSVVIANLSSTSFEMLRYVPAGVFRVGVVHSDDAKVYQMIRHYAPHLDLMAAVSETIRQKAEALPEFARVPVRYLPLGVPMPAEARPARDITAPLRILYLGRLDREQKRVHLFPAMLEQLQSSGIPFAWTLAGDGPERAALEARMQGRAPEQTVSFTGTVPYGDVPRLLWEHDVFLLASDFEGLPLGLLEAMGAGLVPVVSDLPSGIRELVDETTGKRVAPDNLRGYAEAIVWLHEHRGELRRSSENAQRKVRSEFSTAAMAGRWLEAVPKTAASGITWPEDWSVKAPLPMQHHLRFSRPGRAFRRLALKLRGTKPSSLRSSSPS
jgi:glycosyltransferase involved in cell wall biosynthesis